MKLDSATINRIVFAAEQGSFVLFARVFDAFCVDDGTGAGEQTVLSFFKAMTDDFAIAETAIIRVLKVLEDVGIISDEAIRDFHQGTW